MKHESQNESLRASSAYSPATLAIHADDHLNSYADVAPALHISTTFRYENDPEKLHPVADEEVSVFASPQSFPHHFSTDPIQRPDEYGYYSNRNQALTSDL